MSTHFRGSKTVQTQIIYEPSSGDDNEEDDDAQPMTRRSLPSQKSGDTTTMDPNIQDSDDQEDALEQDDPLNEQEKPIVSAAGADTTTKQWTCSQCTLQNDVYALHCTACNTANPDPPDWPCPQCTLKNSLRDPSCTACNYPNPYHTTENVVMPMDIGRSGVYNIDNMPLQQAWKRELQRQQAWCCSYWANFHAVVFILMLVCFLNAATQFYDYFANVHNDAVVFVDATVSCVGIGVGGYGLYGMYHCIPTAFVVLTIYVFVDIVMDIIMWSIGQPVTVWEIAWCLIWLVCAWQFYKLYKFGVLFKRVRIAAGHNS
eukprot:CAMPEP_0197043872 /NCGR_PEP_ID=MMETSP1384-20130603/20062_1 /TAXON_ID=29189 /ORGANISM="Ammonia sp." /LENGTH=315 /DNA_ID=CAMNT_0042475241 /DNA_START=80 /DNA_END=1027 /DNA_ORIENTATION=+